MYFEGVFLKLLQVDLFTKRGNLRTFGSCDENVNFLLKFILLIRNFFRNVYPICNLNALNKVLTN